jgi:hypothetical protein
VDLFNFAHTNLLEVMVVMSKSQSDLETLALEVRCCLLPANLPLALMLQVWEERSSSAVARQQRPLVVLYC